MNKGFTLIELLVVVAIIAIISSLTLAALGTARNRGNDAGIKANLVDARGQAEIFYNNNSASPFTYTNVCTNGTVGGILAVGSFILTAAQDHGLTGYTINGTGTTSTATCNDSVGAWAGEVPISTSGQMWCVDSAGHSKQEGVSIGAGAVCN